MLCEGRRRAGRGTDVVDRHRRDPRPGLHRRAGRRPAGRSAAGDRTTAASSCPRWTPTRCWPGARTWCWSTSWRTPTRPDRRIEKRWQDVDQLLDAGIDVITTVNIQHLESLNDVVAAITGIKQTETVPDSGGPGRRADRTGRHDPAGAAPADGARAHLPGGPDRHRAGQLLPGGKPHRAAGAGAALGGRPGRGGTGPVPGRARHQGHLGGPGPDRGRADRRSRRGRCCSAAAPGSPAGSPAGR